MRQRAVVVKTEGKIAEIEVSRASMCDGCQKNGGCEHHCELSGLITGSGKTMRTTAQNKMERNRGIPLRWKPTARRSSDTPHLCL